MKKQTPDWLVAARQKWRAYVLAALSLLLIWGVAAFAWGSLNAWAKRNVVRVLEETAAQAALPLSVWLKGPFEPLKEVLNDSVLQTLPTLPLGLASPAAQRWLDEQTQKPNLRELILADMANGRTLLPFGSTPPPAEVLGRISVLQQGRTTPFFVASGSRNAMLYAIKPLPAQPTTVLILPRSLRQLAPGAPILNVPVSATLEVQMPHANGKMAYWQPTEPMRLEVENNLNFQTSVPEDIAQVVTQLNSLREMDVRVTWIGEFPPLAKGAHLLIGIWAVMMSLAVLWPWVGQLFKKALQRLSPLAEPVMLKVVAITEGPRAKLTALGLGLTKGLNRLSQMMAKILMAVIPEKLKQKNDPDNWRKVGLEENTVALTDGPGGFVPHDFNAANKENAKAGSKLVLKPLNTELNKAKLGANHLGSKVQDEVYPSDEKEPIQARVLRCLSEGLLELLYQPIYKNHDGTVYANEVLARLADSSGVISPGQFIPVLAAAGRLSDLDALVFERIMAVHFGGRSPSTVLSLNVSGNSLEDLTYLRDVAQQGQGVLQHIIFEVRSNEVVRDPNALQLLKALQRQGAKVAIDYFGGGAGMVQATHAIGLDIIKADAMRLNDKQSKKEMLEMCLAAAKVNVPVVMEKIEDSRMEDFARHAGVKYLQGYSLGKPTPTLITLPLSARLKGED